MSENRIYEFGLSADSLVEQIISIREYRAINRYNSVDRATEKLSENIHNKSSLTGENSTPLKSPDSFTEAPPYQSSTASNSSSEFFDRFYIHDHMRVISFQAKFKTGFSGRDALTTTPDFTNTLPAATIEHEKAEIYELNTHQVISLKGIRVNHKA